MAELKKGTTESARPSSRWYTTKKGTRLFASPLRDNYNFSDERASVFFDICIRNNGEPKTERDLQFLIWYSAHKFGSIVTDLEGKIVEKP